MKQTIATENAPKAIGPYSQGTSANGLIYSAGQIALDPATGTLVGSNVAEETEQVFKNLRGVLDAAGSDLSKVLKTTVFLATMNDFGAMNEVYAKAFGDHRPARTTVAVSGLPKGAKVEIEVVAVK